MREVNFVRIWLKGSIFEPNVKKSCYFSVSQGPTNNKNMRLFKEIMLFIVLVTVKYILLHYTEFQPKLWIGHKFLKD